MIVNSLFFINKLKSLLLIITTIYLAFIIIDIFWFFVAKENKVVVAKNINHNITKINSKLPTKVFGRVAIIKKKSYSYKKVQATKLNLTLIGVINKPGHQFAIIQSVAGVDKIYTIGDKINSSAVLTVINNNFVIIDHNGRDEKLILKFANLNLNGNNFNLKPDNKVDKKQKTENNIQADTKKIIKEEVSQSTELEPLANKLTTVLKKKNKKKLKRYLKKSRVNPANILSIVRVEPNFIAGLLNGFKIYPAKERDLFFKLGFKSGDIITRINDIELNNLSKAFKIGKGLSFLKIFNFVILRKNQIHYIYLDLN